LCAIVLLITSTGCLVAPFEATESKVEVLSGTDSAGATIEITTQKGRPTSARVRDIVLGEGEAEVTQSAAGLAFTIAFPAGATITYTADFADAYGTVPDMLKGVWVQHARGIFGQDAGTWAVERQPTTNL
jgi:hypothetical protein